MEAAAAAAAETEKRMEARGSEKDAGVEEAAVDNHLVADTVLVAAEEDTAAAAEGAVAGAEVGKE